MNPTQARPDDPRPDAARLLDDILANAPDGIILTDPDGRITVASASVKPLLGHDPEALVGTPVHLLYPAGRETADHLMASLERDGSIVAREMKVMRSNGVSLEISLSARLLRDDRGRPSGMLGIFRDNCAYKQLSRQVFQGERMAAVATLAGGIAHNFNNLLMSIQGYTSLMLMDISQQHRHFGMLSKIETQVAAGSRLTRKLMGFAREGQYTVKPVNINHLIADVSERFRVSREAILIENDLDEGSPAVTADRAQLEEAFWNLFMNAADAMPGGGRIACRTRIRAHTDIPRRAYALKPGAYVQIAVADTGCGIHAEHLPFIFEPFYSTKDISEGAGLGLASVFGIVKAHGGFIDAASTPGAGAVFEILLPAQAAAAEPEAPASDALARGNETILVVDDDDIVLEVAQKMLAALGYRTVTAGTAAAAQSAYADGAIDLVLLDLSLEDDDGGVAVFHAIRRMDAGARVLIASGRSLDDDAQALLDAGAGGFIQKPFGLRDLSAAVRKVMGGSGS